MASAYTDNENGLLDSVTPPQPLNSSTPNVKGDLATKTPNDLEKEEKLNKLIYILGSSEDKEEKMETLRLISQLCHRSPEEEEEDEDGEEYHTVESAWQPAKRKNSMLEEGIKEALIDSIPLPGPNQTLHTMPRPPPYPPPFSLPIPLPTNLPLDNIPIPNTISITKIRPQYSKSDETITKTAEDINSIDMLLQDYKNEDLTAITKTRLGIVKLHTKFSSGNLNKTTSSFPVHKRTLDGLIKTFKHPKKAQNKLSKQLNDFSKDIKHYRAAGLKNSVDICTNSNETFDIIDHLNQSSTTHDHISNNITSNFNTNSNNNDSNNMHNLNTVIIKSPEKVDTSLNVNNNIGIKKLDIQQRISEWKEELLRDMSRFRSAKKPTILNNDNHEDGLNIDLSDSPSVSSEEPTKVLNKTFIDVKSFNGLKMYKWPVEMVKYTSTSNSISYSCNPLSFDFLKVKGQLNPKIKKRFNKDDLIGQRRTSDNKADLKHASTSPNSTDMKMEMGFDDNLTINSSAAKWETSEESGDENYGKSTQSITKKARRGYSNSQNKSKNINLSSSSSESYYSDSSRTMSYSRRKRNMMRRDSSSSRSCSSYSSESSRSYSRGSSYSSASRYSSRSRSHGSYRSYQRSRKTSKRRSGSRSRSRSFSRYSDRNFMKRIYNICPTVLPKIAKKSNQVVNKLKTESGGQTGKPMTILTNETFAEPSSNPNSSTSQIPLPDKKLNHQEKFQYIGPDDPLVFKTSQKNDEDNLKEDISGTLDDSDNNINDNTGESFVVPPDQLEKYRLLRVQAERHAKRLKGDKGEMEENCVAVKDDARRSPTVIKEYKSGNSDPQMQLVEELYLKQMASIMGSQPRPIRHHLQQRHHSKIGVDNVVKNKAMMRIMDESNGSGTRMLRPTPKNYNQNHMMNSQAFIPFMHVGSPLIRRSPLFIRPQSAKSTMNIRADFKSKTINKEKVNEQLETIIKQPDQGFKVLPDNQVTKQTKELDKHLVSEAMSVMNEETTSQSKSPHTELREIQSSATQSSIDPASEEIIKNSKDIPIFGSSSEAEVFSMGLSSQNETPMTSISIRDNINMGEMHDHHIQNLLLGENLVKSSVNQQDVIRIVQLPTQQQLLQQQQQQQHIHLLQQRQIQIQQQQQLHLNLQLQQQQQIQLQSIQSGNLILASPIQPNQISVPIINRQGMIIGTARKQPTLVQMPGGQLITPTIISGQPMIIGSAGQVLLPRFIR